MSDKQSFLIAIKFNAMSLSLISSNEFPEFIEKSNICADLVLTYIRDTNPLQPDIHSITVPDSATMHGPWVRFIFKRSVSVPLSPVQ